MSGFAQIWYLGGSEGATVTGTANLTQTNPWHIAGIADFNGDGTPDVVWQDPVSGAVQVWFMGGPGGIVQSAVNLTENKWGVKAVADFNLDGHPDVVFEDPASGAAQIYFFAGPQGTIPGGSAVLSAANPWYVAGPH